MDLNKEALRERLKNEVPDQIIDRPFKTRNTVKATYGILLVSAVALAAVTFYRKRIF